MKHAISPSGGLEGLLKASWRSDPSGVSCFQSGPSCVSEEQVPPAPSRSRGTSARAWTPSACVRTHAIETAEAHAAKSSEHRRDLLIACSSPRQFRGSSAMDTPAFSDWQVYQAQSRRPGEPTVRGGVCGLVQAAGRSLLGRNYGFEADGGSGAACVGPRVQDSGREVRVCTIGKWFSFVVGFCPFFASSFSNGALGLWVAVHAGVGAPFVCSSVAGKFARSAWAELFARCFAALLDDAWKR